jgi:acyl-coenzyme A synthetase/AMP-(fatty) acid ligase
MINIAGKRGSMADLGRLLAAVPGVEDSVLFLPTPEAKRLAALVVAPGLKPSAILQALRDSVDPVFLPRPVLIVPSLPRQETGKLPQRAVLDLFMRLRSATAPENDVPAEPTVD